MSELLRVAVPGKLAFQLRGGEEGISAFDPMAVDPPLAEDEPLAAFRPGSTLVRRDRSDIAAKGLAVVPIPGDEPLSERLRQAYVEIRPGAAMTRPQFKHALKDLE